MLEKRCVSCKRPAYTASVGSRNGNKWLCPACEAAFEEIFSKRNVENEGGSLCKNCKKRRDNLCRFSAAERQKVVNCSDWESKNYERVKRRWAKFEQE